MKKHEEETPKMIQFMEGPTSKIKEIPAANCDPDVTTTISTISPIEELCFHDNQADWHMKFGKARKKGELPNMAM